MPRDLSPIETDLARIAAIVDTRVADDCPRFMNEPQITIREIATLFARNKTPSDAETAYEAIRTILGLASAKRAEWAVQIQDIARGAINDYEALGCMPDPSPRRPSDLRSLMEMTAPWAEALPPAPANEDKPAAAAPSHMPTRYMDEIDAWQYAGDWLDGIAQALYALDTNTRIEAAGLVGGGGLRSLWHKEKLVATITVLRDSANFSIVYCWVSPELPQPNQQDLAA